MTCRSARTPVGGRSVSWPPCPTRPRTPSCSRWGGRRPTPWRRWDAWSVSAASRRRPSSTTRAASSSPAGAARRAGRRGGRIVRPRFSCAPSCCAHASRRARAKTSAPSATCRPRSCRCASSARSPISRPSTTTGRRRSPSSATTAGWAPRSPTPGRSSAACCGRCPTRRPTSTPTSRLASEGRLRAGGRGRLLGAARLVGRGSPCASRPRAWVFCEGRASPLTAQRRARRRGARRRTCRRWRPPSDAHRRLRGGDRELPASTSPATTPSSGRRYERHRLRDRLPRAGAEGAAHRERAAALAKRAREGEWNHEDYLAAVLAEEVAARESHGGQHRVKAARFPQVKTLDDFDFGFQRSA